MKTMTCKQLGGKCDQKLSAGSWDEMVKVMTKHVLEKHPDVAKAMDAIGFKGACTLEIIGPDPNAAILSSHRALEPLGFVKAGAGA